MMWKNATGSSWASKAKKKKKLQKTGAGLLLAGLLALVPPGAAHGSVLEPVDEANVTHNEVRIDSATGQPVLEDGTNVESLTTMAESVTYDKENEEYVYSINGDTSYNVKSNIVDGMYTNDPVTITCGVGISAKLYRNGKEVTDADLENISGAGRYVLLLNCSGLKTETAISFRIIDRYTNAASYKIPQGFVVSAAYRDGEELGITTNQVSFEQEGEYVIYYACGASGINYTLDCVTDHTAPTLALEAVDENGIARGAVDLSDLEEGAAIYAELDGDAINPGTKLTQPGRYSLTVADQAGNTSVYNFVIRLYFTVSAIIALAILLAVIGGLTAYVVISRRNLKVR